MDRTAGIAMTSRAVQSAELSLCRLPPNVAVEGQPKDATSDAFAMADGGDDHSRSRALRLIT